MQVSERNRHDLYEWARATMGEQRADTLMSYLPPVGWGDVATRRDLELLEARFRAELAEFRTELRTDLAEFRAEMADRFRHQTNMLVGAIAGLGGLLLAVGSVAVAAARYF